MLKVLGSNFGQGNDKIAGGILWLFSVPPGNQVSGNFTESEGSATSIHLLSIYLFTNYPIILRHILSYWQSC
jgi:hypothetical protein